MWDKNILQQKPEHNPLLTPDGYFDQFTDKLMQRLPEQQAAAPATDEQAAKPRMRLIFVRKMMRYAAAVIVACLCIGTGTYIYTHQAVPAQDSLTTSTANIALSTDEQDSEDYLDQALDYEMIGNDELAYYLTEAY